MKAKYILRGLGLGMIITAVVMSAYTRSAVADARADVLNEYGITQGTLETETVAETQSDTEAASEEADEPVIERDETLESQINSVLDAAAESEPEAPEAALESETAASDEAKEEASEPEASDDADTSDKPEDDRAQAVTIEISKGDDSGSVSRKLYNAGLVENASEFDAFLMQHGYDKKINTGTKLIYPDDSWQEIAEKLTR
ncbi:MAG: hypothetical protein LUE96_07960 [Lachnospiraceae bacterium]|nr:hypothetical protein [Lachnospiraceae bacterium]